ncbi:MAG: hypothetical protein AAB481_00370 [Patescibacteria group bacterium]
MEEKAAPVPLQKKKSTVPIVLGVAIIAVLIAEIIWAKGYLSRLSESSTTTPPSSADSAPKVPPTQPPKRLVQGRQTFTVSSTDRSKGPQFSEIVVDPYDPAVGKEQTMTIAISDTLPVARVSVTVATDKGRKSYPMKLISGEATKGVWEATWTVEDTHEVTYNASFMAQDSTYTDTVTLTMR